MRAPLLVLLAAALLAAAPVRAQPVDPAARTAWYEQKVQKDLDRDAAEKFLADRAFQETLKASRPEKLNALFRVATDVKDFNDLLHIADNADTLRKSLVIRLRREPQFTDWPARSVFSGDPQILIAWTGQREKPEKVALLKEALWEWPSLTDGQRGWLSSHGRGEAAWKSLPFEDRAAQLAKRALDLLPALLAATPRSRAQVEDLRLKKLDIQGALDESNRDKLDDHFTKADVAVAGIERLARDAKVRKNAEMLKQLEKARAAGSVDEALTALDKIFDHIGERSGEVATLRPEKAEEALDDKTRGNLERMLGPALLKEVGGTTPGDLLRDFFKTHELKLKLKDLGEDIAVYHSADQSLQVNDKYILRWLKSSKRSSRDLMTEPGFSQLVMLLATTFVHESFHQVQHAWAESENLPFEGGHVSELESMQMEGVYLLEKRQRSPRYRAFLDKARADSSLVDGDMRRAARLRRDPAAFRASVTRDNYPNWPSLEGMAQGDAVSFDFFLEKANQELDRRRKANAIEQFRLKYSGLDAMPKISGRDAWVAGMLKLKTPKLEKLLQDLRDDQAEAPARYAAWRKRYEDANVLTTRALKEYESKVKK